LDSIDLREAIYGLDKCHFSVEQISNCFLLHGVSTDNRFDTTVQFSTTVIRRPQSGLVIVQVPHGIGVVGERGISKCSRRQERSQERRDDQGA
jgi:hypothetical protein